MVHADEEGKLSNKTKETNAGKYLNNKGAWVFGLTDGGERRKKDLLIICYCPLISHQVFIQDITDTQILTVTHVRVCVRVPFCALPYNPGCKWSLLEQRMRPLPSISLITSKLLPLFFPVSLALTQTLFSALFLSLLAKSEKNDVSLSVHSKPHCSCLGCVSAEWLLVARTL